MRALFFLFCLWGSFRLYADSPTLLNFEQALNAILDRSTRIAEQSANTKATEARNLTTHLRYLPSLSVEGSHSEGRRSPLGSKMTTRSVEGVLSFNLFKFGADRAAIRRADAQEEEQQQQLRNSVLIAEAEAVRTLVQFIQSHKTLHIQQSRVEIRSEALSIAQQRYRKGLLAKEEVEKVAIEKENALATQRDAEAQLATTRAQLKALLGHQNIVREWPWKQEAQKTPLSQAPSTELSKRPDWQAAQKRVESADYEKDETFGKILPSLDFTGTYGYQDNRTTGIQGTTWSGTLSLSIPLFDRLSQYSSHREAVYRKAAAEQNLENIRRLARAEWEASKIRFRISLKTAEMREKTVKKAVRVYEANLQRFKKGLTNVNDLMLDQDRMFNSELLAVNGWGALHLSLTELCHSAGHRVFYCLKNHSQTK